MINNTTLIDITNLVSAPECTVLSSTLSPSGAFFYSIAIITLALFFHEFGHYIHVKTNPNSKIEFFIDKGKPVLRTGDITGLNKQDKKLMYFTGIALGFIPIFIAMFIHQFFGLLFTPYIIGCIGDIKEIVRLNKK